MTTITQAANRQFLRIRPSAFSILKWLGLRRQRAKLLELDDRMLRDGRRPQWDAPQHWLR